MVSVFVVAQYILHSQGKISTWKLHKLCYYCQAWHMVWTEKRLIREDFEAWINGPVCPELFHAHQDKFMICESDIAQKCSGLPDLNDDERDSIEVVLGTYGSFDPYELREMTHRELPWKEARGDIPNDAKCQNVIPLDSMASFYSEL